MLVFSKARLVFLSVPKTETSAYEAALGPQATMIISDPPELKHAPVFRYNRFFRPMLEKFVSERMDVLAVMREPINWLGSWYRYRQRDAVQGQENATHGVTFDEFVLAYMKGNRPAFAEVGSQAKFLETQKNGTGVTHLFRYEDQPGLIAFLEERLQTNITLPNINVSPAAPLTLSSNVEMRFRRKFAGEFQLYDSIEACGRYKPLPNAR